STSDTGGARGERPEAPGELVGTSVQDPAGPSPLHCGGRTGSQCGCHNPRPLCPGLGGLMDSGSTVRFHNERMELD
ncbi:hypothetical protein P7K49_014971, partial [Saguinus oedipus]